MKCFSGIQRFIQLNNIDEKCLEKAAENLEIRKVKKNQYILHEGEPTGFFAGLIKGKVSIRKTHIINRITNEIIIKPLYKVLLIKQPSFLTKNRRMSSNIIVPDQNSNDSKSNSCFKPKKKNEISPKKVTIKMQDKKESSKKNYKRLQTTSKINFTNREERNNKNYRIVKETLDPKKYLVKEQELFRQSEGYCFGEWALIYKEPRSASIYTLEDCIFFTLDEFHFRNSFLKSLNNSEYSKKKFALQHFLPFSMTDERQLSIYKNIVPITCKRNQIIFEENDVSNCVYLVYLGSFTLEKNFGLKQIKILDLGRGSIIGLESIFEGENSKYKCTLKLSRGFDFGMIFKLEINILRPYIINKMKISFQTNYNVFIKSLNILYYKNILLQKKLSMERKGEYDDEEGKSDLEFLNNKGEKILNDDGLKNDWKNLLNIGNENKYETIFKKYIKSRIHNYHLKNRLLKINSLRQNIKKSELNSDDNINDNHKNINIFKYFKDTSKKGIKNSLSKTSNSIRNKLIKSMNINDDSQSKRYLNTFNSTKKNLTDRKNNDISIDNEIESINKILFKDKIISSNKYKLKNIKDNYNRLTQNLKSFKINKKILYDNNILNDNIISNKISDNQLSIEYSKNNSNNNNAKVFNIKNIFSINFMNKNSKSSITNSTLKNHKKANNSALDIAKNKLDYIHEKGNTSLRKHLNNKVDLKHNYIYLSNKLNLINSPNINDKRNELFSKIKSPNLIRIGKNKLNIPQVSGERKNHYLNGNEKGIKNRSFVNLKQKNISMLSNNSKSIFMTFVNEKKRINIKSAKNQKNKIFSKSRIYDIIKKKYINNNNEVNLSNGFSVSYFEKINLLNYTNNANKGKIFPSEKIIFKESFDSGIFNIPLISSSIKQKNN